MAGGQAAPQHENAGKFRHLPCGQASDRLHERHETFSAHGCIVERAWHPTLGVSLLHRMRPLLKR